MGDQVAVPLRIGAQAQGRSEAVEMADKSLREPRPTPAGQPAHVGADRHDEAAGATVVAVMLREVTVNQQPGPLRRGRERCDALEVDHCPGKSLRTGLGDQLGLVVEMRIEPAMRESRPPHDLVHPCRIHPTLAKSRTRRGDNAAAGVKFVIGRITQDRFE